MSKTAAPTKTATEGVVTTWAIANLERQPDGKVLTVHYTVNSVDPTLKPDGTPYTAGAYGSVGLEGDLAIPFDSLTPDVVVGWVKAHFGAEKVTEIEQALINQLSDQKAPKVLSGVPW